MQENKGSSAALVGGKIYIGGEFAEDSYVIFGEDIVDVGTIPDFYKKYKKHHFTEIIDISGLYLAPGFIDIHIHGFAGSDTMDGTSAALKAIASGVSRHGVTAFLAATITARLSDIRSALENIGANIAMTGGARLLGAHLEGPFINSSYAGAQPAEHISLPDDRLVEEYRDIIRVATIAPEVPGAIRLIRRFAHDIRFSLGHSGCTKAEADAAFECGARGVTHLFNAMTPLHHREPGLVGAALLAPDAYVELICDNLHIHPHIYSLVFRAKSAERVLLITDSIRAGGLSDGTYDLGGQDVSVSGGRCTLADGTLAGSVLCFDEALRNIVHGAGIPLETALKMTSQNQAKYLGIDDRYGSIARGFAADFVVLDSALRPVRTIVGGVTVWKR